MRPTNISFTAEEIDLIDTFAFQFNVSRNKIVRSIVMLAFDQSIVIQTIDGDDLTFRRLTELLVRFQLWREKNKASQIEPKFNNLNDLMVYNKALTDAL